MIKKIKVKKWKFKIKNNSELITIYAKDEENALEIFKLLDYTDEEIRNLGKVNFGPSVVRIKKDGTFFNKNIISV